MPSLLDIHGQDAALEVLFRALAGQRRPHAFIFEGPEGVGRRTCAEGLANTLLCSNAGPSASSDRVPGLPDDFPLMIPCGHCDTCRSFAAGTHPDYHPVHRELARFHSDKRIRDRVMQDLGIDVIREFLIEPAQQYSSQGRGRVFVVRHAELMNAAAQNALLKTLEEPPPAVIIILICSSAGELLPTIRSRCALVRFGGLPRQFVTEQLKKAGVADGEASFWAGFTAGSLGVSLRLAGGEMYAFKRELVDRLAGLVEQVDPELGDWLGEQADKHAEKMVSADKLLAKTLATRQAAERLLALLAGVYRDAMSVAVGRTEGLIHADQADRIARIAENLGGECCAQILAQLAEYARLLWSNLNPKIIWDNVVITCATGTPLEM